MKLMTLLEKILGNLKMKLLQSQVNTVKEEVFSLQVSVAFVQNME